MARKAMTAIRKGAKKKPTGTVVPRDFDTKYTGEEPMFFGWEDWPLEKFFAERRRIASFYSYHKTPRDMPKYFIEWMKLVGYSKNDIKKFRESNLKMCSVALGGYAAARVNGMPSSHPNESEWLAKLGGMTNSAFRPIDDALREEMDKFLTGPYRAELLQAEKEEDENKPKVISPVERIQMKVDATILSELDEWEDDFMVNRKIENYNMFEQLKKHEIPANGCARIAKHITDRLGEYEGAYTRSDKDLVEGYSNYSRPELKKMVGYLKEQLAAVESHQTVKKAVRKPRVQKPKSAMKQIERLKFEKENNDFKLASINPVTVIGAQTLYTFHTASRTLTEYVSERAAGFEIKGTTLVGFDIEKSRSIRLRKPEDVLPIVLKKTKNQIDKAWSSLTTKQSSPNGRINDKTILLRVLEK